MRIVSTPLYPSREDAVRLKRSEKLAMIVLAYVTTVMDDLQEELKDRIQMVDNGAERLKRLSEETERLLNDLRLTVPMNQRMNLQNTGHDFDMHLTPKLSPTSTSVIMQKEEFRELVDHARVRCRECTEDDNECEKCKLFQLLTVILPMDDYHARLLCPYNLGEWAN